MKTALIIGISSQDGYYLSAYLRKQGIKVVGTSRQDTDRLRKKSKFDQQVRLEKLNPADYGSIEEIICDLKPEYIYNLAAQSSVGISFEKPLETINVNFNITLNLLEVMRTRLQKAKLINASSSEVFGNTTGKVTSSTEYNPVSPYGLSKAISADTVKLYRNLYGLHATNLFLFNHESPLRPDHFVTKKIINYVKKASVAQVSEKLKLGNVQVERDWGLAAEYVEAMFRATQLQYPIDCVICTGKITSLQTFIFSAFEYAGLEASDYIEVEEDLRRANELFGSVGDTNEAINKLNWKATTSSTDIIKFLFDAE